MPALLFSVAVSAWLLVAFSVIYFAAVPTMDVSMTKSPPSRLTINLEPLYPRYMTKVQTPWNGQLPPWEMSGRVPQKSTKISRKWHPPTLPNLIPTSRESMTLSYGTDTNPPVIPEEPRILPWLQTDTLVPQMKFGPRQFETHPSPM